MRTLITNSLAGVLIVSLWLSGCSEKQSSVQLEPESQPVVVAGKPDAKGISWFDGSVEEAFSAAKATDKPVFLYWGAQWCPPCYELKENIFRRDEFIAQSKLFVPVQLDGDTERAQKYGDQFGVVGYPTVIIFSPQGIEITRIPGGLDIQRYLGVLELALNALNPVSELLLAVDSGEQIRDADWKLLANYSWGQDRGRALGERQLADTLWQLAQACPQRLTSEKSQLQIQAIEEWAADEERDQALATGHLAVVNRVLADETLRRVNLNAFIYGGGELIKALAVGEEQVRLQGHIVGLLEASIGDPQLNLLTRIEAMYGWVDTSKALLPEDGQLTAQQQAWLQLEVENAREDLNSYQQHAALSTIAALYFNAGLQEQARAAAEEGMAVSRQPHYFMSMLSTFEREAGNTDEAIAWSRQAWDSAKGPATRTQWGTYYLLNLLKLSPDDLESISNAGDKLLAELSAQPDALHNRNSRGVTRLSARLLAWSVPEEGASTNIEQRKQVLISLRKKMEGLCSGVSGDSDATETCNGFLVPDEADA